MPLKNFNTLPPGGWRYVQAETGYKVNEMGPASDAAKTMLIHRRDNNLPGATMQQCFIDLDNATCDRLGNDPAWCDSQKKTSLPINQPQPGVAKRVGQQLLSSAVSLVSPTLRDWLGDGGISVADSLAQARAKVCIEDCSEPDRDNHFYNRPPGFFSRISAAVADAILEQRREKTGLGLAVENEDKLHTCAVCDCHLPLKVWVPMDVIKNRTTDEQMKQFPKHCWMVTENRTSNTSLAVNQTKPTEE